MPNPFLIGALVLVAVVIVLYNGLIRRRNQSHFAFASVDALLKKRHDLIPNLVETVRGYMTHERELLERITDLRSRVTGLALAEPARISAETELARSLAGVFARVEAYPELRANENMLHLQVALTEIEEQISAARRFFNSAVTDYNTSVESFPSNLVASMLRFQRRDFFEIPDFERAVPSAALRPDVRP
jgi:LemA protein